MTSHSINQECVLPRKHLTAASSFAGAGAYLVVAGSVMALSSMVQPSLALEDASSKRECRQSDSRGGVVMTICSWQESQTWKVAVESHNGSGIGKSFSISCLPGSHKTIAADLRTSRLDCAPYSKMVINFAVDAHERPKITCKFVRMGDNYSDEPAEKFEQGIRAYEQGDYSTALQIWEPFAEQGDVDIQHRLGEIYLHGQGVTQDFAVAAKWFRHAAEQGHSEAEGFLGALYANGDGVQQDDAEAVKWFRLAAEHGDAYGQDILGETYENGYFGVQHDYVQAVKWYRLSAEQGYATAQNNLGFAYEMGHGVAKDYAKAVRWYRLAVDQDYSVAQNNLGFAYESGQGVPQDYGEALRLYRLSAEQGYAQGQRSLGAMFENGRGVSRDYVQAHMWFSLAVAGLRSSSQNRREQAEQDRDRVAVRMTPSEIVEAEKLASEWKPPK